MRFCAKSRIKNFFQEKCPHLVLFVVLIYREAKITNNPKGWCTMKKLLSIILVVAVVFSLFTTVFADYQYYDIAEGTEKSVLTISGTTATCTSQAIWLSSDVASFKITQTLEKQGFLWIWSKYDVYWTKTLTKSGSLTTTVYDLSKGKYRVKSVFLITMKDGTTQTITVYSTEKSVS